MYISFVVFWRFNTGISLKRLFSWWCASITALLLPPPPLKRCGFPCIPTFPPKLWLSQHSIRCTWIRIRPLLPSSCSQSRPLPLCPPLLRSSSSTTTPLRPALQPRPPCWLLERGPRAPGSRSRWLGLRSVTASRPSPPEPLLQRTSKTSSTWSREWSPASWIHSSCKDGPPLLASAQWKRLKLICSFFKHANSLKMTCLSFCHAAVSGRACKYWSPHVLHTQIGRT